MSRTPSPLINTDPGSPVKVPERYIPDGIHCFARPAQFVDFMITGGLTGSDINWLCDIMDNGERHEWAIATAAAIARTRVQYYEYRTRFNLPDEKFTYIEGLDQLRKMQGSLDWKFLGLIETVEHMKISPSKYQTQGLVTTLKDTLYAAVEDRKVLAAHLRSKVLLPVFPTRFADLRSIGVNVETDDGKAGSIIYDHFHRTFAPRWMIIDPMQQLYKHSRYIKGDILPMMILYAGAIMRRAGIPCHDTYTFMMNSHAFEIHFLRASSVEITYEKAPLS